MEKIKYLIEKYKIIMLILLAIIILTVSIIFKTKYRGTQTEEIVSTIGIKEELKNQEKKEETINKKVKVDIKGLIEYPGVYELSENSRVIDVIKSAGGLKEDANTEYINLSKKITDEMVIIIYSNKDIENLEKLIKKLYI